MVALQDTKCDDYPYHIEDQDGRWRLKLHLYTFFYKQPVYKQPVLRPLKNVATFEAQKSPVA